MNESQIESLFIMQVIQTLILIVLLFRSINNA